MVPVTMFAVASGLYFSSTLDARDLLVGGLLWLTSALLALWLAHRFADTPPASQEHLRFAADIMHEIQVPMSSIDSFADLLLQSKLDPSQADYVNAVKNTSQNLVSVINNVLNMDQIDSGNFVINMEPFNLRECVEDVITILTPAIHKKDIDVILFIYSDAPECINFDPVLLRQILINLIGNSLKFTPEGDVVVRVMLEDETGKDVSLKFTVTDTGVGISEQDIHDLFTPSARTGSGLGLSICKKLIEKMGEDIGVSSTVGKGSEFWFTLHCAIDNTAGLVRTYPAMKHKNIVIYDSNEISQLALRHALTKAGAHPITVNKLQEVPLVPAKGKDISWKIDAVYLSLRQQECCDDSVIEKIEHVTESYDCPVIVLSYCNVGSIIEQMYAAGITCHIRKPARLSVIASALTNPPAYISRVTSQGEHAEPGYIQPSLDVKVLVAEDNVTNAKLISVIMRQCGITPVLVNNGRDAIQILENNDVDIILMDIHMPILDGIDTTRYIREQLSSDIPIIAITANAVPGEIERFFAAGINECLIKPIRTHQLFKLFKQYLDLDLAPDYEAMNDIQRDILVAEDTSILNDLVNYKTRISASMSEQNREKLLEHVHKLNGIASFFNHDSLRKTADALETAIKKGASFSTLSPLANQVYEHIDDALKSRRAS